MEQPFVIKLRFNIYGFNCHPDEITNLIGIQPDHTWRLGDPVVPGVIKLHEENGWRVQSALSKEVKELDSHWADIKNRLLIIKDAKKLLPENTHLELSVIVKSYQYFPEVHFEIDQISLLADLDAEIDIDIYDLRKNQ